MVYDEKLPGLYFTLDESKSAITLLNPNWSYERCRGVR